MQALQESPLANEPAFLPSGIVNPNYVEEDDASSVGVSASKSSTLPLREKDRVVLEDLCEYMSDMSFCRGSVNCHGSDGQMYHSCESSRSGEIFLDQYRGGGGLYSP